MTAAAAVLAARADTRQAEFARAAQAARAVAEHLTTLAAGVARAAEGLPDGVTGWQGPAALAATAGLTHRESRLHQVATAFGTAAGAAAEHAVRLQEAAALLGPAVGPAVVEPALLARAEASAGESARLCTGTLSSLAGSAPPRRSRLLQGIARLDQVTTHFTVGVVEAFAGLGVLAASAATVPMGARHRDGVLDPGDVVDVFRDPKALGSTLLDLDTWRDDPARAVGHLAPDLISGLSGAGAATASRGAKIAGMTEKASARAAYRQQGVLAVRKAEAKGAGARLITRSLDEGTRAALDGSPPWRSGGSRLDPLANAQVEAFHRLSAEREAAVTRQLQEVARQVDARLDLLESRLKTVDSLKRKIADGYGLLAARLERADDVIRYTLVLDAPRYTLSAHRTAALLAASGLHLDRIWQAWDVPANPYRGINSVWSEPRTGVKVEVQFHTPDSRRATIDTHPQYEEKRARGTTKARRDQLDAEMFPVFATAKYPPGVLSLEERTLIPAPPPDPFTPPPDVALAVAVLAGATTGAASRSGGVSSDSPWPAKGGSTGVGR